VVIGNEAIFTKVPHEPGKGLIGMDFIRLALERSQTAWEALYCITQLLETYGQGGSCGFTHPVFYHNSFLLADSREAWVLETAGRQWAAEKVNGVRSISNIASIGSTWDLASDDLVRYAVDNGWSKNRKDFHFARCYSDITYTTLSDARSRQLCTTELLKQNYRLIDPQLAMQILRAHGTRPSSNRNIDLALAGATVCMHAGGGPVRGSQSVGSMVVHLTPSNPTAWVTGTSAPCTSIFKPVWLDAGLPLEEPSPQGSYDPDCLWWRHENLHRAVLADYAARISLYEADRDRLEDEFIEASGSLGDSPEERRAFSKQCFSRADEAEGEWFRRVTAAPPARSAAFYYTSAWKTFSQQAGMI
jgi:dipeptidase